MASWSQATQRLVRSGQLKLLNLTQKLQDLLAITKLLNGLGVYEKEDEALNSYK